MVAHTVIIIFIISLSVNYFQMSHDWKCLDVKLQTLIKKDFFKILPTLDGGP